MHTIYAGINYMYVCIHAFVCVIICQCMYADIDMCTYMDVVCMHIHTCIESILALWPQFNE